MEMQLAPSSPSSASIGGKFKTVQATAYAKVDARYYDRVPVMVSITALPGTTAERAPLDLVVVLHVRKGLTTLPNNWDDLLAEAMDTIVTKLQYRDRLSVIPGRLTLVTPKRYFVSSPAGQQQLITRHTTLTGHLESAESILYGREDKDKTERTGCIIVISNSDENIDSLLCWRLRSVHAFGFRDAHNARTMHSISSSRDCSYAVLDDECGRITQAFFATIARITSTAGTMPVEVKLMCEQTVVLKAIGMPGGSYYLSYDDKAAIMWPSVHMAGVTSNIIVYLGGLIQPRDLRQLFAVHVKYGNVSDKLDVQLVKEGGSDGSQEVAAEIVRMEAVEIVADVAAEDKCDWEQLHAAADALRARWATLVNSDCGREAGEAGLISGLDAQMREMEARLYNNYYWLEYMLSWQSHQKCQFPLPQPFMDSLSTIDPLLQLRILAKADDGNGTITDHQKGLPVMVRVMAPETALAMVKRASVDLILLIDASRYGAKEKEEKSQKRLEMKDEPHQALLTKAIELVTKKLSVKDRLAIIPVQSFATEPATGLLEMSSTNKVLMLSMSHALRDERPRFRKINENFKALHWREQKKKAMTLIRNCLHTGPSSSTSTPMSAKTSGTAFTTEHSTDIGGSTNMLHKALMYAMKVCWMRPSF